MPDELVIYKRFSNALVSKQYDRIAKLLAFAGINTDPDLWTGSRMLIALLFAVVGFLLPFAFFPFLGIYDFQLATMTQGQLFFVAGLGMVCGILFGIAAIIIFYLHLYYIINDRTSRVESVLPDFLMMVAANLRAGMTPFTAFQISARPEFGPLEREIKVVAAKSLGTESLSIALNQLTERVDSLLLKRTIGFFEQGLRSGGKLADLLETAADEIRETQQLKRELALNTRSYMIFMFFVLIIGLPLLLSISTQFLITFSKIQSNLNMQDFQRDVTIAISAPKLSLSPDFVNSMSYVIIVGTSILVSLLVGIIAEGKFLYGVKYFVPLAIASFVVYTVMRLIISSFIGAIF